MKDKLICKPLSVRQSAVHGYGVFAECDIAEKEIIEECYTVLSRGGDSGLAHYYFWGTEKLKCLTPTGFGFVYNHSAQPNATYYFDEKMGLTIFTALKPIAKNEEIFISYGPNWFSEREMEIKEASLFYKIYHFFFGMPLRAFVVIGGLYVLLQILH